MKVIPFERETTGFSGGINGVNDERKKSSNKRSSHEVSKGI
jgi:hypothetical protein